VFQSGWRNLKIMPKKRSKKYLKNQKRRAKRGLMERNRKKKRSQKNKERLKKMKQPLREVKDMNSVSLTVKIRYYIYRMIWWIKRAGCIIGIHDWKICSGREGDSMYTCIRCWKGSRKKWGKGGSEGYYKEKEKYPGIADPDNWEKKEGEYYFKGKYVKLTKEEVRRLEVILKTVKEKKMK